jgi:hypothetical protein
MCYILNALYSTALASDSDPFFTAYAETSSIGLCAIAQHTQASKMMQLNTSLDRTVHSGGNSKRVAQSSS